MTATSKPSTYIPGLDGLRAIAFLLVFGAHSLPDRSYYIPATLGVTIFFFLSGFLITTLLRKELGATGTISLRDFYIRRTLRIFVPLYLVYALTAACAHFMLHESPGNGFGAASVLLFFHNYTIALRAHAFVPEGLEVVWSLAVEEHFYLLFPLVYLTLSRRKVAPRNQTRLLAAFCLLELAWRWANWSLLHHTGGWNYIATDTRLDSILWGSILALRNNPVFANAQPHPDKSILPRKHPLAACALAVVVLVATLVPRNFVYRDTLRYTLQALALYVIFSYVVAGTRHPAVRWLEWTPLRYIGWTSYVLYLSHGFLIHCMELLVPGRLWLSSLLGLALALLFATLLRYTLELPLQHLRARYRHPPPPLPGDAALDVS